MSSATPVRTPFREIGTNISTPQQNGSVSHKGTPRTSPGPALLLGIKLSAKKKLLMLQKSSPLCEKENEDDGKSLSNLSGVPYFRKLLSCETSRITDLCEKWESVLNVIENSSDQNGPSDVIMGDIRTTVGQGRLIMRERFHQFKGLVDNCEFGTSEKTVTCQDLQGFWDMIYFQVEDVDAKFDALEKCKSSNWDSTFLHSTVEKKSASTKPPKKKPSKSAKPKDSRVQARNEEFAKKRAEARKRLAAAKAEMKRAHQKKKDEERITFDAGFFKIDSPIKSPLDAATNCLSMKTSTESNKSLPENHGSTSTTDNEKVLVKKLEFLSTNSVNKETDKDYVVEILVSDQMEAEELVLETLETPKAPSPVNNPLENAKLEATESGSKLPEKSSPLEHTNQTLSSDFKAGGPNDFEAIPPPDFFCDAAQTSGPNIDELPTSEVLKWDDFICDTAQTSGPSNDESPVSEPLKQDDEPCSVDNLIKLLFNEKDDVSDDEDTVSQYKPHYFRLLAKVKALKNKLNSLDHAASALPETQNKMMETMKMLENKSKSLDERQKFLDEKEAELNERKEKENSELLEKQKTIEDLETRLFEAEEKLEKADSMCSEQTSSLDSIRKELLFYKNENANLSKQFESLNSANLKLSTKIESLKKDFEECSRMHNTERARAEAFQNKMNMLGKEIDNAFKDFSTTIEEREEKISFLENRVSEMADDNIKLSHECQSFQDRVETLEYVEDEMKSLQEQLTETEESLKQSQMKEKERSDTIEALKSEINILQDTVEKMTSESVELQEELDMTKSHALLVIGQKDEELAYGNAGLKDILNMMQELEMKLQETLETEDEKDLNVDGTNAENQAEQDAASFQNLNEESGAVSTSQDDKRDKTTDEHLSILAKKVLEKLKNIIKACGSVNTQFHKEIEKLDFHNSVLRKQLATSENRLLNINKEETELECFMRKRIEELTKKNEEKDTKLVENTKIMRLLSDQNVALTDYKIKFEELSKEIKYSRRGRSSKRRSSSAGALKSLP